MILCGMQMGNISELYVTLNCHLQASTTHTEKHTTSFSLKFSLHNHTQAPVKAMCV